ncbi:MAG: glutamate--tRNA ligase [Candidatus Syntropharchaeia archaeon]
MDLKILIRKYALQNAIKHDSPPRADAVIKKIIGEYPELKKKIKEIVPEVKEEIEEIASMGKEKMIEELMQIAPELLEELKEKKVPKRGLPDLEVNGKVIMRFAPNPNGPPTLGSARGMVVNSEYARKYGGEFILRFDDTDPVTKRPLPEAYGWYIEDCEWLGTIPDRVVVASERIDKYYEYAEKLIDLGGAYVCFCPRDVFKRYRDSGTPCSHRDTPPSENREHWKEMLDGKYEEKEAVLRIKTDIAHKDPAIRDWVAFRIIKANHPRVGKRYIVWPMLDFESAIEDHLLGITHIIRGKDLADSEKRQRYIYVYFGWEYPRTIHWGRVKIFEFGGFSTSGLRKMIEEGRYSGWDDPALPTLRALRRRGIQPQAIREFIIDLGIGENDISLSLENLYAKNRKIVDPKANRYFFVWNPVKLKIENIGRRITEVPIHPEKTGFRRIEVESEVYITEDDFRYLTPGSRVRLKYLCDVEITSISPPKAKVLEEVKNPKIIHWVPVDGIEVRVKKPDGEITGIGEKGIFSEVDRVVQFERFGFVRIDGIEENRVVAYFGHG